MIEATIKLIATSDGGRQHAIFSGYRPQFYFDGEDFECRRIEIAPSERGVMPGETANVRILLSEFASKSLRDKIARGREFELHEGSRAVAYGTITGITDDP